jgi:hypothetical protein
MFGKNKKKTNLTTQTSEKEAPQTERSKTQQKKFMQKRIPTMIGLGVLIVALVAGTLLFSQGTGVFAPRATPQTTPKKIKITNVTDSGFTVSFLTDEATVGFVKYGTEQNKIKTQVGDDRDQLSGTVAKNKLHHITLRGLEPNTQYFFNLGTGSGSFDNNNQPFSVKTAQRTGVPSAAKTVYGSVVTQTGKPADGAIVYLTVDGIGEMSSLVKSSGSWAIPLSNARKADGSGYAQIKDQDTLTIMVQGSAASLTSTVTTLVADAQPVANITLGESKNLADAKKTTVPSPVPSPIVSAPPTTTDSIDLSETEDGSQSAQTATASSSTSKTGGLADLVTDDNANEATNEASLNDDQQASGSANIITELDLEQAAKEAVTLETTQPVIKGKALPNVTVSIEINSQNQITQDVVADANGDFSLDLEQLKQELEPGEHTITYSYIDPDTGETITKTETFTVEDTSQQLAQADTSSASGGSTGDNYPYSSSNPYSPDGDNAIGGASDSATLEDEASSSSRTSMPATDSAMPVSGNVGTTYTLILGGLFFILAGAWSWWVARNLGEEWV